MRDHVKRCDWLFRYVWYVKEWEKSWLNRYKNYSFVKNQTKPLLTINDPNKQWRNINSFDFLQRHFRMKRRDRLQKLLGRSNPFSGNNCTTHYGFLSGRGNQMGMHLFMAFWLVFEFKSPLCTNNWCYLCMSGEASKWTNGHVLNFIIKSDFDEQYTNVKTQNLFHK